mmetsp:Transcript_70813/g.207499  ORF Transcript_70813/g.207499 Transcript_70813/m.207499 type:complete len:457 (+) Transcript_70813:1746-3116(+)
MKAPCSRSCFASSQFPSMAAAMKACLVPSACSTASHVRAAWPMPASTTSASASAPPSAGCAPCCSNSVATSVEPWTMAHDNTVPPSEALAFTAAPSSKAEEALATSPLLAASKRLLFALSEASTAALSSIKFHACSATVRPSRSLAARSRPEAARESTHSACPFRAAHMQAFRPCSSPSDRDADAINSDSTTSSWPPLALQVRALQPFLFCLLRSALAVIRYWTAPTWPPRAASCSAVFPLLHAARWSPRASRMRLIRNTLPLCAANMMGGQPKSSSRRFTTPGRRLSRPSTSAKFTGSTLKSWIRSFESGRLSPLEAKRGSRPVVSCVRVLTLCRGLLVALPRPWSRPPLVDNLDERPDARGLLLPTRFGLLLPREAHRSTRSSPLCVEVRERFFRRPASGSSFTGVSARPSLGDCSIPWDLQASPLCQAASLGKARKGASPLGKGIPGYVWSRA